MNEVIETVPDTEKQKKFTLVHGCHRGTLMSRDTGAQDFNSMAECKQYIAQQEDFYRSIGYMIWFAHVFTPDGTKVKIHPGNSYS